MAYKKLKLWFDKELAKLLASKICEQESNFNSKVFLNKIDKTLEPLELKDRVEEIADRLHSTLGESYTQNIKTLIKILGPENENETGMFTEYYWVMPIAKYVEKYGLKRFKLSMKAIEEITKRNTGEYTIRPYLEAHPEKTIQQMTIWSTNSNKHVRRLSCEGLRPRLPWATKLDIYIQDPTPIIPILENLKDDRSKYVQKSVANCINDILKDNPKIGKSLIEKWNNKNKSAERKWIIKHALRNLIKKEDSWGLKMRDIL